MQQIRIVCFSGIDGSGKTAHARRILFDIQKSGRKCKYVWSGSPYFFSYLFMALCRFLGLTKVHCLPETTNCSEHEYYKNKPIALVWPWIRFLDLIPFFVLRIYIPLLRGFIIVCDRFVEDALVDIMTDVNDDRTHRKLVGRLTLRLAPKSTLVILLDVEEATAFKRKNDIPSLRFLARRRSNYLILSRDLSIPVIEAERPFALVQERLLEEINKLLLD